MDSHLQSNSAIEDSGFPQASTGPSGTGVKPRAAPDYGPLSLPSYPRQTSQMDHLTPPPTFLHLCLISDFKKKIDSFKWPYLNWQNAVCTTLSQKTPWEWSLLLCSIKKGEAKWLQWLFVCLVRGGGGGVRAGMGDAILFPPHFIPPCLNVSTCPLGKQAYYFCWESACLFIWPTLDFFFKFITKDL